MTNVVKFLVCSAVAALIYAKLAEHHGWDQLLAGMEVSHYLPSLAVGIVTGTTYVMFPRSYNRLLMLVACVAASWAICALAIIAYTTILFPYAGSWATRFSVAWIFSSPVLYVSAIAIAVSMLLETGHWQRHPQENP